MLSLFFSNPIAGGLVFGVLLFSLTAHEFAHGWMADRLGDPTARILGRLSLNPLVHLDPLGSAMLIIFGFGWAKPVPIDPFNFKNQQVDTLKVAAVGPLTNVTLAMICAIVTRILIGTGLSTSFFGSTLILALSYAVFINITLALFNLLPIAPLDGFKVVAGFLREKQLSEWLQLERYGFIFLLAFIIPLGDKSLFTSYILPMVRFITDLFLGSSI